MGVELLSYCLMIGAFSAFLQVCYQEGMILNWYYKAIQYVPSFEIMRVSYRVWLRKTFYFLSKPLGVCVYCQNFWINIVAHWYVFGKLDGYIILTTGGTFLSVELILLIQNISKYVAEKNK